MQVEQSKLLTTSQAARRLGLSEATVRLWVKKGKLQPVMVVGRYTRLFDPAVLGRLAEGRPKAKVWGRR
jgi:excisionase family DNA binding protein